jgi:hypothetical protein
MLLRFGRELIKGDGMAQTIDLSPKELNLKLYSGDGASFRLIVTDKIGESVPLTGIVEAQIRAKRGTDDDPDAEFEVDLTEAADGIAILSLSGEKMQELAPVKNFVGFWDVQWTPEDSEPRTLVQGKVECGLDVTR